LDHRGIGNDLRPILTCNHLVAYNPRVNTDAVFKALADPSRRKLLDRLFEDNGQRLTELCVGLRMTRQAVSKHLGILERANLVATLKRGRDKEHYLNPVPIHEIAERWIGKYERGRLRALHDLKNKLESKLESKEK
jgi:DNA-binding transcriptional ArsR family regulator